MHSYIVLACATFSVTAELVFGSGLGLFGFGSPRDQFTEVFPADMKEV